MRLFTVLGIIFYATLLILIGMICIVLSLNLILPQDIYNLLLYIQDSINSRIAMGLIGVLLILISFSFAQLILGRFQRERTIAFSTSSGEVTIALSAVEDLIKRLAGVIPEIRELRPDVIAGKKGILVDLRVVLKSEANIPDLTTQLQTIVKSKIQEVLGIEEQIVVKIHIAKIIPVEEKKRRDSTERNETTVPFGGYTRM